MKLSLRNIFKSMMEAGYYPVFEDRYITFDMDGNMAVVEYHDRILSLRLFYSIEPDAILMFKEASNITMMMTYAVKPVVIDDMQNLMFSCEFICDTEREFRKFFPLGIDLLNEALAIHKSEMKKLLIEERIAKANVPATDEFISAAGTNKSQKIVS